MTTIQPANEEQFQNVLAFGKEILDVCKELSITPIVYGSLAYFLHTNDETLPVNDIDFLVPEAVFQALTEKIGRLEGVKYEKKPFHSIEVFKDGIEIDLDGIEHFLDPRPRQAISVTIDGIEFQILNRASLIEVYQEALDKMPDEKRLNEKGAKYQKKLANLKTKLN
jgi:hypothetical protein